MLFGRFLSFLKNPSSSKHAPSSIKRSLLLIFWRGGGLFLALGMCAPRSSFAQSVSPPVKKLQAVGAEPKGGSKAQGAPALDIVYFGDDLMTPAPAGEVRLLCVVRNNGDTPIGAGTAQLRCLALSGLDYTSGDITPALPALEPHQAVAYCWRLAYTGEGPMLAAAILSPAKNVPGTTPSFLRIATVAPLGLDVPLRFGPPLPTQKTPSAGVDTLGAWVGANRIGLRVIRTKEGGTIGLIAARNGAAWQLAGVVWPLLRVCSAEDGVEPWWHTFFWQNTRFQCSKTKASLELIGSVGRLWRATLRLTVQPNSASIEGDVQIVARTSLRLQRVQIPQLLFPLSGTSPPSNGTPLLFTANDTSLAQNTPCLAAYHLGALTGGIVAASTPPLANWQWQCARGDAPNMALLTPQWQTDGRGALILPMASVDFPFRLFALAPSSSEQDALRFQEP